MPQKGQTQVLILAGIVLVLALAGGIFFLGRVTTPKPQPRNVTTPSPQPSLTTQPTPPSDETVYTESDRSANWKTYTHSKFSFKHPTHWYAEENPEYPGGNNVDFFLVGTKADFGYGDHIGNDVFGFTFSSDDRTLEKLKSEYYPKAVNITIGGKPALKTFIGNSAFEVKLSKNEILSIAVWNADEASPYIDQILSTFRFLD